MDDMAHLVRWGRWWWLVIIERGEARAAYMMGTGGLLLVGRRRLVLVVGEGRKRRAVVAVAEVVGLVDLRKRMRRRGKGARDRIVVGAVGGIHLMIVGGLGNSTAVVERRERGCREELVDSAADVVVVPDSAPVPALDSVPGPDLALEHW